MVFGLLSQVPILSARQLTCYFLTAMKSHLINETATLKVELLCEMFALRSVTGFSSSLTCYVSPDGRRP
jgi:hypothetical protein